MHKGATMANRQLNDLLDLIAQEYQPMIQKGSRHYLEVAVGKQAERLGYADLKEKYRDTCVIVPLKTPRQGMKVRIDGRTFVNYAEHPSGIAFPGDIAKELGRSFNTFVPNDSMICNFV
jgi:hypothetical protein